MNIGIYGDSFASVNDNYPELNWSVMLGKKFTESNVTHYSWAGTSVYYSYKKFLNNYHKNDINIFLVTNPYRYTKTININNEEVLCATLNHVEMYKKEKIKNLLPIDVRMLDDLMGWYISSDQEFLTTASELMINQISVLDNKVILFPCFEESFTNDQRTKYKLPKEYCMFNYVLRCKELLNIDISSRKWEQEIPAIMAAHLPTEFNQFVAESMYKKITTSVWDFSNFENIKLEHPKEYYYK